MYKCTNIKNIISSIKTINDAVRIPISDTWHLTPPRLKGEVFIPPPAEPNIIIANPDNSMAFSPTIESDEYTRKAIHIASDCPEADEGERSTDALAWYVSFHNSNYWGIYIPLSNLLRYAGYFLPVTDDDVDKAVKLAYWGLIAHESVHYAIDVACAHLEIISNSAVYIKGRKKLRSPQGHVPDEEQIAEAALLRFFQTCKIKNYHFSKREKKEIFEIAHKMSLQSRSGYRDGILAIDKYDFMQCLNLYLQKVYSQSATNDHINNIQGTKITGLLPIITNGSYNPSAIDFSECPVYVFNDIPLNSSMSGAIHYMTVVGSVENPIVEGPGFMDKVRPTYIKQWNKTKVLLGNPDYPKDNKSLDFKRWAKEDNLTNGTVAWSVRVGGKSNMRAHINQDKKSNKWVAYKFGNADKMGHHKNKK